MGNGGGGVGAGDKGDGGLADWSGDRIVDTIQGTSPSPCLLTASSLAGMGSK